MYFLLPAFKKLKNNKGKVKKNLLEEEKFLNNNFM